MDNNEINYLVNKAKQNDSEALEKLVKQYHPLILSVSSNYQISSFDADDMLQEARIVCYRACNLYDETKAITFGAYFKTSLVNQYRSLFRKDRAKKRLSNINTISIDTCQEYQPEAHGYDMLPAHVLNNFEEFYHRLTITELASFMSHTQSDDPKKIQDCYELTREQLERAKHRCFYKLKNFLFET